MPAIAMRAAPAPPQSARRLICEVVRGTTVLTVCGSMVSFRLRICFGPGADPSPTRQKNRHAFSTACEVRMTSLHQAEVECFNAER